MTTAIPVGYYLTDRPTALLIVGAVFLMFVVGECLRLLTRPGNTLFQKIFGSMLRAEENRKLTGATYLLGACWLVIFSFPQQIAITCMLFLTVSDALAALAGKGFGRSRIYGKTLEGSAAFFVSAGAIGALFFEPLLVGFAGALCATVAELLPSRINDNLSIPLLSGCVMFLLV